MDEWRKIKVTLSVIRQYKDQLSLKMFRVKAKMATEKSLVVISE